MTSLPAHLELIVADARTAAVRAGERSRRRRRRLVAVAVAFGSLAVGLGVADAVGGPSYVDLVRAVYPDAQVNDLGDRQQEVIADLGDGVTGGVLVTDLGVTDADAPAPAGTGTCEWDADTKGFGCSAGADAPTIPAGTHVYRLRPRTPQPGVGASVMYVPSLGLELLVAP